jgi:hypothetical protein
MTTPRWLVPGLVALVAGGQSPPAHRLVEEMRIAPGADDTTLFTQVYEFRVAPSGRIWVYDGTTNSIFLFGPNGKLIRHVGRQGGGPGEYKGDGGMVAIGDSGLAIWDPQNARISFLDPAGAYRTSWRTPTGFFTSNALVTDRSGTFFLRRPVTPPREGEILGRMGLVRLKVDGTLGDSLVPPDLKVPGEEYVAVGKSGGGQSRSSMSSTYASQYYWGWHPAGYFVVADGGNYRVILSPPGKRPVEIHRDVPRVPIATEERDEEHARITYSMRRTDPSWSWSGPALPSVKAPVLGLFVARDGRIWVQVAVPSERIPLSDLTISRDKAAPVMHFRTPLAYDVFEPDGRFLGRIGFPQRTRLVEARGDLVWALGRDADDLPAVIRFHIQPGLH